MTFKVGDIVRCIRPKSNNDRRYDLPENSTYVVTKVSHGQGHIDLEGLPHLPAFLAERFELAKLGTPQDRVLKKIKEMESRRVAYG